LQNTVLPQAKSPALIQLLAFVSQTNATDAKTGVTMANLATLFCAEGFSEVQLLWIVPTMAFSTAFVPDLAGQCRCNLLVVRESAWGVPTPI
jgi:hypothetical protein